MRLTSQPVACRNTWPGAVDQFCDHDPVPGCGVDGCTDCDTVCDTCKQPIEQWPPPLPPTPHDEWAEEHWGSPVALIPIPF